MLHIKTPNLYLFQMIEDTLIQNSCSEITITFNNEPMKEIGTQMESKKLFDKKVRNSNKMAIKSTQYTLKLVSTIFY